jgi:hypothetical protein
MIIPFVETGRSALSARDVRAGSAGRGRATRRRRTGLIEVIAAAARPEGLEQDDHDHAGIFRYRPGGGNPRRPGRTATEHVRLWRGGPVVLG